MNENTILRTVPAAGELHKVPGFDPMKHLHSAVNDKGEPVMRLEPRYQRLWFRLACPKGRMLLTPLHVTHQLAIFEAKVFFHRDDATPASSFTSSKTAQETSNYIRAAQDEAMMVALDNAGFGIQLCDLTQTANDGQCRPFVQPTRTDVGLEQPSQSNAQVEQPPIRETPPVAGQKEPMAARQVEPETPPVETANAAVTEQPASEPVPADQPAPESVQAAKPSASAENISDPAPQPAPAPAPADQPAPAPEAKADPVPEEEATPAPAEAQGTMGNDQHEGAAQADSQQHNLITMLNFPSPAAETDNPQEAGSADPANAVAEPSSVENMTEPAAAAETVPGQEETPPQTAPSYTEDMSVEEICQVMTMEEAGAIVVARGPCMGWTMAQVAERRPSSLRFFLTKFCECSNSQKAAATLLMQDNELKKAG